MKCWVEFLNPTYYNCSLSLSLSIIQENRVLPVLFSL
jgi:hypothetical protein